MQSGQLLYIYVLLCTARKRFYADATETKLAQRWHASATASDSAPGLILLAPAIVVIPLLAPAIVVIPLYNWLLERQPFTSGPFVAAIEMFLAWYY